MSVNNFIDHSSSPFITRQHRISYINPHSIPKAAPNNTELAEYFDIQYYDGKVSILKFLGFWKLLKVCVHEGVRKMHQLFPRIDVHALFNRLSFKIRTYNYAALFIRIVNFLKKLPIMGDYRPTNVPTMLNVNEILTSSPPPGILYRGISFDNWNLDGSDTDLFSPGDDATSMSSERDSGISNPQRYSHLENQIEDLKSQLLALSQLVKSVGLVTTSTRESLSPSKVATVSSSAPPPPPPPPPGFLNIASSLKISKPITQEDSSRTVSPPPTMHDVLKELNTVKLRSIPRSPGGTPCRPPVKASDNFLKSALQNKFKNAHRPDDSFENGLDDSAEGGTNWD